MAKKTKSEMNAGTEALGVDLGEIERLLEFMQAHGLEEFEYQHGDKHVRLRKVSQHVAAAGLPALTRAHVDAPVERGASPAAPAAGHEHAEDVHTIKSPIVGTFYSSPSPDAAPFVAVGAHVDAGQVLCIIEAMKLMNEIESDVAGEIVRVHVENGKPVEYGAALFDIRTRAHAKK
jgi:acetyl-CoA carboxylase biotin carboxyl carrier protein